MSIPPAVSICLLIIGLMTSELGQQTRRAATRSLNDTQLVAKWLKESGLSKDILFASRYEQRAPRKEARAAKRAGTARDVAIARWLERNNGTPDDARALWRTEVRVGMTQEQAEIITKLERQYEAERYTEYKAYFFDWIDGEEIAQPAFAQVITIDRESKVVTSATARFR